LQNRILKQNFSKNEKNKLFNTEVNGSVSAGKLSEKKINGKKLIFLHP
jgi:hypothetical protein